MAKAEERDHVDRWLESAWLEDMPFLDLEVEGIVDRMNGLSRRLRRRLNAVIEEHGLTYQEWDVLGALRQAGPPFRRSAGSLAKSTELSSGAMTNRLDRLEKSGLVKRLPDPDDRRGVLVELTKAGEKKWVEAARRAGCLREPDRRGSEQDREEAAELVATPADARVRDDRGRGLQEAVELGHGAADRPGCRHRPCPSEGRGPRPRDRLLPRRARLRAHAAAGRPGGVPFRGRLPPPHRAQHVGVEGRLAAAAGNDWPLPRCDSLPVASCARGRAEAARREPRSRSAGRRTMG